jgi:hypothetical protein
MWVRGCGGVGDEGEVRGGAALVRSVVGEGEGAVVGVDAELVVEEEPGGGTPGCGVTEESVVRACHHLYTIRERARWRSGRRARTAAARSW